MWCHMLRTRVAWFRCPRGGAWSGPCPPAFPDTLLRRPSDPPPKPLAAQSWASALTLSQRQALLEDLPSWGQRSLRGPGRLSARHGQGRPLGGTKRRPEGWVSTSILTMCQACAAMLASTPPRRHITPLFRALKGLAQWLISVLAENESRYEGIL